MRRIRLKTVILGVALLAMTSAPSGAQTVRMSAQEQANLKLVLDWWREVLQAGHLELTSKYMADGYIQHNINVPTGREGFVKVFSAFLKPTNPIPTTLRNPPAVQFAKGDFVVLVWEQEGKDPADSSKTYKFNTYDMLRVQNAKIQEHWDFALKMPGIPTGGAPDGIDYDKVTFALTPQEQKNLEVANVEFKDILQYGHVELAEKVMAPGYIQHNPNVPGSRAGFVEFFGRMAKPEPIKAEWKNKPTLTVVNGPYVFYLFKQARPDPDDASKMYPVYWFDMVRVADGMVQEHWDAATKMAPGGRPGGPAPGPGGPGNAPGAAPPARRGN